MSAVQKGLSSERPQRVSLKDASQGVSSSEDPLRVSSTEELPKLAPRSPLRVHLHRISSSKHAYDAFPLWRFFGTSFWVPLQERGTGDLFGGTISASLHGGSILVWLLGASL
jgi:hypothetical protein